MNKKSKENEEQFVFKFLFDPEIFNFDPLSNLFKILDLNVVLSYVIF